MPAATVTVRELKNKDTGIDLSIPSYKEVKGMLGSSYEYQVMVVSNLQYFKTAKHKESDNVQFVVYKKFADFEELYSKMNTKYSGTAFPPLPKRVLMVSEAVAKERRSGVEYIMKFLAMTPKLCTCPILLEFLGVNPKKMVKLEVSDKIVADQDKQTEQEDQGILGTETEEQEQTGGLFEDEAGEDDDTDMFAGISSAGNNDTDDTKIFDEPELGGGLEEGEADDLFLTEAKVSNTQATSRNRQIELEDNSDLFDIDDDIDKIMTLDLKPKTESVEPVETFEGCGDSFEVTDENAERPDGDTEHEGDIEEEAVEKPIPVEQEIRIDSEHSTFENKPQKPEIKSKPKLLKKPVKENATKISDGGEISFDDIVSEAEKVVHINIPERPKPAVRKKPVGKGKPDVPKHPESTTKPNVPKRPEVSKDKPYVPKRPDIVKEKPNIPKRPEVVKDKPNVQKGPEVRQDKPNVSKRPETSAKPNIADQQKSENKIGKQVNEVIENEDDVLKYIQENTVVKDEIDLFS